MNKELKPDVCEDLKTMLIQLHPVKDLLLLIDVARARIKKEDLNPIKRRDH